MKNMSVKKIVSWLSTTFGLALKYFAMLMIAAYLHVVTDINFGLLIVVFFGLDRGLERVRERKEKKAEEQKLKNTVEECPEAL